MKTGGDWQTEEINKRAVMGMTEKLTEKQKRFAEAYKACGVASQAYREAGYTCKTDRVAEAAACRLLRNVNVKQYLAELEADIRQEAIADMQEINRFWSETMRDKDIDIKDRLKASELRARVQGAFVDRVAVEATREPIRVVVDYGD